MIGVNHGLFLLNIRLGLEMVIIQLTIYLLNGLISNVLHNKKKLFSAFVEF